MEYADVIAPTLLNDVLFDINKEVILTSIWAIQQIVALVKWLAESSLKRKMKDGLQKGSSVDPIIPTQIIAQSRNPEGNFCHPTSRAYI